jgi:DNA (cytosine-5)-methyltransferase 1
MAHKHKLNTFHLFSGAGGGILADLLLGHNPIGACEIEPYPRDVLLARQRDGHLPAFPIWDDVCTLDGTPWRGTVDVLCGGFPCQDISAAGKGAGITGERSGLWKEYARLIGEMRPRFVFAENSPLLRTRGLGVVLEDLASLGYNARWGIIGARDVGALHKRDRMWVLAYANDEGSQGSHQQSKEQRIRGNSTRQGEEIDMAYSDSSRSRQNSSESELRTDRTKQSSENTGLSNPPEGEEVKGWWHTDPADLSDSDLHDGGNVCGIELGEEKLSEPRKSCEIHKPNHNGTEEEFSPTEPVVGRVADGVANRVDRLKAIGNGQVPQCAAMAFSILSEGLI